MADAQLIRIPGKGFQPMDPDKLKRVKDGEIINVSWTKARNPRFHRKAFALFKYVFECMPDQVEPVEYDGHTIMPKRNFNQTRKWLTIEAGFYDVYWIGTAARGRLHVEPKSLAFSSMDNDEFEAVYTALIDVALEMLPHIVDRVELDAAVETVLRFDGGG